LREGLYKVEFHTVHGTGSGVIYATSGKLRGGNSGFAFIGTYGGDDDGISVKVSTERHNADPTFKPLFGTDMITLTLRGKDSGSMLDFEGSALQLPGIAFKATLTRICD
jgi:T3SS negative regulator,GrlR